MMVFSPSRIQSWIACQRAWAWHYLLGYRKAEEDKALDIGKETHKQMELLTNYGTPIDMHVRSGPLAAALEPYVREYILKPGYWSEGEFAFPGKKHPWRGYIDLEGPGLVIDYKTSSDPHKWAVTAEQLLYDPAAIVYATKHFLKHDVPEVELRWLYVSKKNRKVLPVSAKMSRKHAEKGMIVLEALADQAIALDVRSNEDIMHLPLAPGAPKGHCKAYGGCPHRATCGTYDWGE